MRALAVLAAAAGVAWYAVWRVYRHCALCGRAMGRWGFICNHCTAEHVPATWRTRA